MKTSLLLVLPTCFRIKNGQLLFEEQACNGLERWADNFGSVVIAAPTIPEDLAKKNTTTIWRDTSTLIKPERFELVPLPWAYSLPKFFSSYFTVRKKLANLISRCRYLQFGMWGLWGDWGSIAAIEAHKQKRTYSIHTDIVADDYVITIAEKGSLKDKIKAQIFSLLMKIYHRWIIRRCALGLWHGQDCYTSYSPFCWNNYLIHDIHLKVTDKISDIDMKNKIAQFSNSKTLRICYAGRLDQMKAPLDWVRAISEAKELGVNLQAVWMGDGKLMAETKSLVNELGLNYCIELAGLERDREKLLNKLRDSHLMLFTHITKESPRCLIEALVCGTPIIGYKSEYAQELVKKYGGGEFVPVGEWKQLGNLLLNLSINPQHLINLMKQAAINGKRFNDQRVFEERSEIIKKYL